MLDRIIAALRRIVREVVAAVRRLLNLDRPPPPPPPPPAPRRVTIVPIDDVRVGVPAGTGARAVLRVAVVEDADLSRPIAGARVRYEAVTGDISFAEPVAVTDAAGEATVDVTAFSPGYCLVSVEAAGAAEHAFFEVATEGVVDTLTLFAPPTVATDDALTVEVVAVDFAGRPVDGADLDVAMQRPPDLSVAGTVDPAGGGSYGATLRGFDAGEWTVVAQDRLTRRIATACVIVTAGDPARIRLAGETDPRRAEPYDRVTLQARLEDASGSPLDPRRLAAAGPEGAPLAATPAGTVALVEVAAVGFTSVPITISDVETGLSAEFVVDFNAVWLADPGPVFIGEEFATTVLVQPRPDRPSDHVTVTIEFDPELMAFAGFEQSRQPGVEYETEVGVAGGVLTIAARSEVALAADDFPTGIELGTVTWSCLGEGESCFSCTARMSPTTDPWELCPEQKRRQPRTLCIRVIYEGAKAAHKTAATKAVAGIKSIIGSTKNVAECCPVLGISVSYERIGDVLIKGAVGNDGAISSSNNANADFQKMFAALRGMANTVIKDDCINLLMLPLNDGNIGLGARNGDVVVDPSLADATLRDTAAHEVGHALGLAHTMGDQKNLMVDRGLSGGELTDAQCKTVQQNLGDFGG